MEPENKVSFSQTLTTLLSKSTVTFCDAVSCLTVTLIRQFVTAAKYEYRLSVNVKMPRALTVPLFSFHF